MAELNNTGASPEDEKEKKAAAAASTGAAGEPPAEHGGDNEGGDEEEGQESTELQRKAQLSREFAALRRKEKELAQREKVGREKLEAEQRAANEKLSKYTEHFKALQAARAAGAGEWLKAGGFTYDQATDAQLKRTAAPGQEDPRWKRIEERLDKQEAAMTEREKRLAEREMEMKRANDLTYIAKEREKGREKYELLNHFADDDAEKIDEEIYQYMIGHHERYGELPTLSEAFDAIEEAIEQREEARVKKSLAARKIARRVGWSPQQDQPGDDAGKPAEPHEQQTNKPARGKPTTTRRAPPSRKGRSDELPLDSEDRLRAMQERLKLRRA